MPARKTRPTETASPAERIPHLLAARTVESAAELQSLADSPDKAIAKAARRALYQLKLAGIEPPVRDAAALESTRDRDLISRALLSNVSGTGGRMALFVREDPHGGNPTVISLLVNDTEGVVDGGARKARRSEIDGIIARLNDDKGNFAVDVPIDYARSMLDTARTQRAIPKGLTGIVRLIGPAKQPYGKPPVYELMNEEEVRNDLSISRQPESLLDKPVFMRWLADPEQAVPWLSKLDEALQTPLELTESQLRERGEKAIDDAADALMRPSNIRLYRRRLEEMAHILHLAGREEEAKMALYHALTMDDSRPGHESPLLRAIVHRTLALLTELEESEKERKQQGKVIKPG